MLIFDAFAEASCRPYYAARMGAPSVPPGRYFRIGDIDRFIGKDGVPQNAGFLYLLDLPLLLMDQLLQLIEQLAIEMPPPLGMIEEAGKAAIALFGRAWVSAQVPRDT